MSKVDIETELEAIKTVVSALDGLDGAQRERVLLYALETLGIAPSSVLQSKGDLAGAVNQNKTPAPPLYAASPAGTDIRALREIKQPKSANEMAVLTAYYLSEHAPEGERAAEITARDITKYFKQAGYPLPRAPRYTLQNAKNAGYLDTGSGTGAYRINPVGHNLVAHSLPRNGSGTPTTKRRRSTRKRLKKITVKKKATVRRKPVGKARKASTRPKARKRTVRKR